MSRSFVSQPNAPRHESPLGLSRSAPNSANVAASDQAKGETSLAVDHSSEDGGLESGVSSEHVSSGEHSGPAEGVERLVHHTSHSTAKSGPDTIMVGDRDTAIISTHDLGGNESGREQGHLYRSLRGHRTRAACRTEPGFSPAGNTPAMSVGSAHAEALGSTIGEASEATVHADNHLTHTHSRYDAITGRWTIFATGRDARPNDFVAVPPVECTTVQCPFCSGHESLTPPSVLEITSNECESLELGSWHHQDSGEAVHSPDQGAWQPMEPWAIRVIPNKFPAVDAIVGLLDGMLPGSASRDPNAHLHCQSRREEVGSPLFRSRTIQGGHEVFIESPSHEQSILTMDLSQVAMLFRAYQMRMAHWRRVPEICYVSLFKNVGPAAGASLHHAHSQLIATTELPFAAKAVADRMKLHWAKTGCCLQCDMVRAELKAKSRIVAVTDSLVAYCPYGSHLPMLLRITSKRHLDCFEDLSIDELQELARLVRRSIRWLQRIYPDVAYNYLIHTRPPGVGGEEMSHWAMEIFPRVTQLAGFEWSSDCMINPMLPEIAAERFRAVAHAENPLR